MIKSFGEKKTQQLYESKSVKKFQGFRKQAEKRLQILDSATCLDDLRHLPSNHFEALRGKRKGFYSLRINKQWRICFKWLRDEAYEVEIIDYH